MRKFVLVLVFLLVSVTLAFSMAGPQGEGGNPLFSFLPLIIIGGIVFGITRLVKKSNSEGLSSNGYRVIKKRGLLSFIFLGFLTFGIYILWRGYVISRDVNIMCEGDGKKTRGLLAMTLLSLVTFGIYGFIWLYELGDRLKANGQRYNIVINESGGTVLLWFLLGSLLLGIGPLVAFHIVFKISMPLQRNTIREYLLQV